MRSKRLAPKYEISEPWKPFDESPGKTGTYRFRILDGPFRFVEYQYESLEPDKMSNLLKFTYKILCMPVAAIGPAIVHDNIEEFERTIGNILDHYITLVVSKVRSKK